MSANLVSLAAFGLLGSVVAQLGDLTFSAFKRLSVVVHNINRI